MTIDSKYIKLFARTTQMAAYGASLYIGKNDKKSADKAAVDLMRNELNKIEMKGRIVIGEGELDKAPMLYIGERVGNNKGNEFDIAVDPVEGTNFVAKNLPNSIAVLAVAKKGELFHAPETYMDKIVVGPGLPDNLVDLDNDLEKNIINLAKAKNKKMSELTACLLNRPRHNKIINTLKSLNVNLNLITDGDVLGALLVADPKNKVDIFMGIGGGPEGVLAAAALSCFNCQMQTKLIFQNDNEKIRAKKMGIKDLDRKYNINDIIKGDVIFCATGITDGKLVKGIENLGTKFRSETYVTHKSSKLFTTLSEDIKK
jgi:fructose-1,6-bisphosphatase II / sedoheptulose-1,7-bisphosphatase|tara:strand:+ start:755 stop:1699 length:945 start_codon:yes stop_codon:yes gene_type:complete